MTRIRERILDVDEYNQLVPLALGALAASRRLEDLLTREDPEVQTRPAEADDPWVLAVLGLLSLRRTVLGWLSHATTDATVPEPAPAAHGRGPAPGDFLR